MLDFLDARRQEGPSKTIKKDDEASYEQVLVVGATVTWVISVPIPVLEDDESFDTASVTDVLDARLEFVASSSKVSVDGTVLAAGYTVDQAGVTWTFDEDGLAALDAAQGKTLTIEFDTTVLSVGDGTILNKDYESSFNGATVPGEDVPRTYWGLLEILKQDDSEPVRMLEGAEFQVYEADESDECAAEPADAGALVAEGESNADGVVVWGQDGDDDIVELGLWIANLDEVPEVAPSKFYCVYETVVPAGHIGLTAPLRVEIKPGESNMVSEPVTNPRREGPELPLTGGAGTVGLMAAGVIVAGAGVGVMLNARRRRNMAA